MPVFIMTATIHVRLAAARAPKSGSEKYLDDGGRKTFSNGSKSGNAIVIVTIEIPRPPGVRENQFWHLRHNFSLFRFGSITILDFPAINIPDELMHPLEGLSMQISRESTMK